MVLNTHQTFTLGEIFPYFTQFSVDTLIKQTLIYYFICFFSQAERQAVNTTVQGSAADLVKTAMNQIDAKLMEEFPQSAYTHCHKFVGEWTHSVWPEYHVL